MAPNRRSLQLAIRFRLALGPAKIGVSDTADGFDRGIRLRHRPAAGLENGSRPTALSDARIRTVHESRHAIKVLTVDLDSRREKAGGHADMHHADGVQRCLTTVV